MTRAQILEAGMRLEHATSAEVAPRWRGESVQPHLVVEIYGGGVSFEELRVLAEALGTDKIEVEYEESGYDRVEEVSVVAWGFEGGVS